MIKEVSVNLCALCPSAFIFPLRARVQDAGATVCPFPRP